MSVSISKQNGKNKSHNHESGRVNNKKKSNNLNKGKKTMKKSPKIELKEYIVTATFNFPAVVSETLYVKAESEESLEKAINKMIKNKSNSPKGNNIQVTQNWNAEVLDTGYQPEDWWTFMESADSDDFEIEEI